MYENKRFTAILHTHTYMVASIMLVPQKMHLSGRVCMTWFCVSLALSNHPTHAGMEHRHIIPMSII
uniref:Uncharacterized protein n=1 Tax=Octopus bimaculoides TaxID=37653 RepID=A0A0L8H8G7_OCTBM